MEALHNPREDALVRIGIGHKALFAANSMAIGKKSNAVNCPSPGPRRLQGVMQRFLNKFLGIGLTTIHLLVFSSAQSQTLPQKDGRPLMPDDWLFSSGQSFHYHVPASNNGRRLLERSATPKEAKAIEEIERYFSNIASKAYLLGDGEHIVKVSFKAPASATSTFLSASVDKTVTAMSAGIAVCDGKIKMNTKAKELLPELAGTHIGESTLKDNLMMASGTVNALDDSQSLTKDEVNGLVTGKISFMDLLKGRLGKQQGWQNPGEKFSYKTQDPTLVGMLVSAAYGKNGKDFREWQTDYFFSKVGLNDRRSQGRDQFGYAWAEGNTRLTLNDWARFALFVQESRRKDDCYGEFVRNATTTQIKTDRRFARMYGGYGYLTWTENDDLPNSYSALGYGGQAIVWSTKNDKYFIVFSNNINPPEIHKMARLWLQAQE